MSDMHPLGQLIADRMRIEDWSLDDVVARAEARGHTLSRSNLQRIQKQPVIGIKGEVIFALADGLGVTPRSVANAALQSMGIGAFTVEVTDSLATIDIDPSLSEAGRRQLRALIAEMRQSAHTAKPRRTPILRPSGEDPGVDRGEEPPERKRL
jgi:hypothetical protein